MDQKAKQILKENNISYTDIQSIGHHELGRNHVYLIKDNNEEKVLKIYGRPVKFACEERGLRLLKDIQYVPKIYKSGEQDSNWILMEAFQGELLESVWYSLSNENRQKLMEKIGELLGKIHDCKTYDSFGLWQDLADVKIKKDYLTHRKTNDSNIIKKLRDQNLPEIKLFEKAYEALTKIYDELDESIKSVLCHRDFSYRNIIVKKEKGQYILSGLIDYEHCQPDDGSIDFNTMYQYHMLDKKEDEQAFYKGYEKYKKRPIDFEARKRYYMINLGIHSCSWSYGIAQDLYESGIKILKEYLK